ncbi:MAG: hypothetical protein WEF50_09310 [Myxococcota bacterium]
MSPRPRCGCLATGSSGSRSRIAVTLVGLALFVLTPLAAHAGCDVIPGALNTFPSGLGDTNTPFASPDQLVQIRVRPQVCDTESPGLSAPTASGCLAPESLRATFVFFDQSPTPTAPRAVVLARSCGVASDPSSAAWAAAQLPGVASGECRSVGEAALDVVSVPVTGGNECRLNVRLPATPNPALGPDFTLSGPARILVDRGGAPLPAALASTRCAALAGSGPLACIDELYKLAGTCDTSPSARSDVFSHFVALPRPNVYGEMIAPDPNDRPTLRFALDDRGNVLANVDWTGVLAQDGGADTFPPPQLVNFFAEIGSGLPSAPGATLEVVEPAAFTSYSPLGIQLPPLFEPSSDSSQSMALFGSTDARTSVIRVERLLGRCENTSSPCLSDAACGGGSCDLDTRLPSFDLRYCISAGGCISSGGAPAPSPIPASGPGGPGAILPASYTAAIDGFVPLENLNVCRNVSDLTCLLRDERLPALFSDGGSTPVFVDRNADGDTLDTALTLRDANSGAKLPLPPLANEGVAVARIHEAVPPQGPFGFPLVSRSSRNALASGVRASGNGCVATLLAEPDEGGSDDNADGESFDPLLRVYCPDANGNLVQQAIDPAGNAEKLAVVAKPSVLAPGATFSPLQPGLEPLVIAGGRAVFLLDEPGNAAQLDARADVADLALGSAPASAPSGAPAVDSSGELVCFESEAQNLVDSEDKNPSGPDVFCHDFATRETFVVNRFHLPTAGTPLCASRVIRGDSFATSASVAGSGERARVCYQSPALNLTPGDFNGASDVFVLDRCSCDTIRLSLQSDGSPFFTPSDSCDLAASGDVAVFVNNGRVYGQQLVGASPETCGVGPVASDRLRAGGLTEVSAGVPGSASAPTISGDGGVVAFQIGADATARVYVAQDGGTPFCVDADGAPGCDVASDPQLDADGRLLTYQAPAGVLVLDRVTGLAEAVGLADASSSDGRGEQPAVVFDSTGAAGSDAVLRDRVTLLAKYVAPIGGTSDPALSADGRTVAYARDGGVYRTTPDRLDETADADGDGAADASVLAALELESGALRVLGSASQAAVGGQTIAYIDPTGHVFVDGAAGAIGPLTLGGAPALARAVAASDAAVCILGAADGALACSSPASPALLAFGVAGEGLALEGDVVALLSAAQSPRTLSIRNAASGAEIANVSGVRRFRMASNGYVAADQCEPDLELQLNGDGDLDDCLALIVAPSGALFDTSDPVRGTPRHTIVPCTGDVCDDTDPFKIFPFGEDGEFAKLRHLSVEAHEPVLFADLNGDGDSADVVVREFVAGADVAFPPVGVPGGGGNVLAGSETGPGQSQAGAAIPAQVGFCDADGDGLSDGQSACQSDQNCIAQGVCGASPCCVDIKPRVLALADGDGDGVFDVYDNCPDLANPTQDPTDVDGDGTADACDELITRCGDGAVQAPEYCDYADATIDPKTKQPLGSFCNGPAQPGPDCTPRVSIKVSESAVNPDKQGILPTTLFGSPVLNLATQAKGDRPPKMIEPGSLILEPLRESEACGGFGARPVDDLTMPSTYASRLTDQNGDGFLDLSLRFEVTKLGIARSDTQACLRGSFRVIEGRFFPADFATRDRLRVK